MFDFRFYIQDQTAVETASTKTKPTRLRVEDRTVKIMLFSLHRGGGLPFPKANAYVCIGCDCNDRDARHDKKTLTQAYCCMGANSIRLLFNPHQAGESLYRRANSIRPLFLIHSPAL
jgi:hypothetical protein